MTNEYISISGRNIPPTELGIGRAKEIINALSVLNYYKIIECIRNNDDEIIVIEVDIQIPQIVVNDIRCKERIAIWIYKEIKMLPKVIPLRKMFPRLPHCNYENSEYSLSICLDNRSTDDILLSWNAVYFLEDIRRWFKETATGLLHKDDQTLEPFWFDSRIKLILHKDYDNKPLYSVAVIYCNEDILTLGLVKEADINKADSVVIFIETKPIVHGVINSMPNNLEELYNTFKKYEIDIYDVVRKRLEDLKSVVLGSKIDIQTLYKLKLILLFDVPLTRTEQGQVEYSTNYAFQTKLTVKDIARKLNIWDTSTFSVPATLLQPTLGEKANEIDIYGINVIKPFNRVMAKNLSGKLKVDEKKAVLIGLGALGSQIYSNIIRMGLFTWLLIDNDILYPHNLSRHTLDYFSLGCPKVEMLSIRSNILMNENVSIPIVLDILKKGDTIIDEINKYDVIFDCSASMAVSRYLSNSAKLGKRCISSFLNPMGTELVILAEDFGRAIKLDNLEMQYYRFIANEAKLIKHLQNDSGSVRYSTSCRDISSRLSQDYMGLYAAIASNALLKIVNENLPKIIIWQTSGDHISINCYDSIPIYLSHNIEVEGWTIKYDEGFIAKVQKLRGMKLPKETGGAILGSYDLSRKIIYIVDTTKSPPDSVEKPNSYIRGCEGLKEEVKRINMITGGNLEYIGEWHSHPKGSRTLRSRTDYEALEKIAQIINVTGKPALMMIAGDDKNYSFYVLMK